VVLNFLRSSFSSNDFSSLALLATDSLMGIGLRSVVQIRVDNEILNYSSDGTINPLEATLMTRLFEEKRIMDVNNKTIFNYPHISILVKSMPIDDVDKYGRYKDNIALLVEGAEERIKAIQIQLELEKNQSGLMEMVESIRNTLSNVNQTHEEHKVESMKILATLIQDVEASFAVLGLLEDQETAFFEMINGAVGETIQLYNEGIEIDSSMSEIVTGLQKLMYDSAA